MGGGGGGGGGGASRGPRPPRAPRGPGRPAAGEAVGWGGVQGTSHRPVTGQICPLLAADRISRATCSGKAGTKKKMEGRLSGGRNSDRTNPDQPRLDQLCPPVPQPKRNGRSGPSGAPSSRSSSPKSSQAARQKGCRAPSRCSPRPLICPGRSRAPKAQGPRGRASQTPPLRRGRACTAGRSAAQRGGRAPPAAVHCCT